MKSEIGRKIAEAIIDRFNVETFSSCLAEVCELEMVIEEVLDEYSFYVKTEEEEGL